MRYINLPYLLLLLSSVLSAQIDISVDKDATESGDARINISWNPSSDKVYTLMSSDSLNSEFQAIDGYEDTHLEKSDYTALINSDKKFFILNQKDIVDLVFPLNSGDTARFLYPNIYSNQINRVKYEDHITIDQSRFFSIRSSNEYRGFTYFSYGDYSLSKTAPNELDLTYLKVYDVQENGRIEVFNDVPTIGSIVDPQSNSGIMYNAVWPEGLPFVYGKSVSDNFVPQDLLGIELDFLLLDAYDFIRSTNIHFTSINGGLYTSGSETFPFTYSFSRINNKLGALNIYATNNLSNYSFNLDIDLVFTEQLKGYCYSEYIENSNTHIMCGFFGQDSFPVESYNEIPFSEMHIVQDFVADGKIDSHDLAYQKIMSYELFEGATPGGTYDFPLDKPIIFPQIHRSIISSSQLVDQYNVDYASESSLDLVVDLLSDESYNYISVSNHPLNDYNGDYYKQPGLINDKPYFKSGNQKYLYFYKGASGGIWSWSFYNTMPDGSSDSFSGGWMKPYSKLKTGNFHIFEYEN